MRSIALVILFAAVFGGLTGCSPSTPTPGPANVKAPPPENSGADQKAPKSRFPTPPPKK